MPLPGHFYVLPCTPYSSRAVPTSPVHSLLLLYNYHSPSLPSLLLPAPTDPPLTPCPSRALYPSSALLWPFNPYFFHVLSLLLCTP